MKFLLTPLLFLALLGAGGWYSYTHLRDEASGGTITAQQFSVVRVGMTRQRVEGVLGGKPGFRRDSGLSRWAVDALAGSREPRGQRCAYYVDAARIAVFRVCYGRGDRVKSRTVIRKPVVP